MTSMGPTYDYAAVRSAATRLQEWLLHGPAQLANGPEAGGVAGAVDGQGRAEYVYGEITGYYLHWLASPHLEAPVRAAKAAAAVAWCERRFAQPGCVPTRIALKPQPDDWRNNAVFCFDLAMLVGGLAAATRRGLIAPPLNLLQRLLVELEGFAGPLGLLPLRTTAHEAAIPKRWSTQAGPFLVKAAARILSAQDLVDIPEPLLHACIRHADRFRPEALRAGDEPLHPQLYFLEGTLALHAERNKASVALLNKILALGDSDGSLPESPSSPDVRRADIVAQALRLAIVLGANSTPDVPHVAAQARLAANLVDRVAENGAIAFRPGQEQANVWCAMFAEQALAWYGDKREGRTLAFTAFDIV